MLTPPKTPNNNNSEHGSYKNLSPANIYKMQAALIRMLSKIQTKLPSKLYQDLYSKLLHLNAKETQQLHDRLESGNTESVFRFLNKGADVHFKK